MFVGGAALEPTTSVCSERALVEPSVLTAVTRTAVCSQRPLERPCMSGRLRSSWQLLPPALQRSQRYWNIVGLFSHVPFCAVNVSPIRAVPVIVGGSMLSAVPASG